MAKMIKRGVIGELSGKLGQIVLRRGKDGKTIAATPAVRTKPRSKLQLKSESRFARATRYAQKTEQRRPEVWKFYQSKVNKPHMSPSNIAIKDYMSPPRIDEVDLSEYKGKGGDPIYIEAFDKIRVVKVTVKIRDEDGTLLEQGEAKAHNKRDWTYRAKMDVPGGDGATVYVEVRVSDLAGNEVREVVEWKLDRRYGYRPDVSG